jgi:hypothetical protein
MEVQACFPYALPILKGLFSVTLLHHAIQHLTLNSALSAPFYIPNRTLRTLDRLSFITSEWLKIRLNIGLKIDSNNPKYFKFNFKVNFNLAEVAYQWVRDILREEHISQLVEVTYNGENDITALVKQKFNSWSDDLPF